MKTKETHRAGRRARHVALGLVILLAFIIWSSCPPGRQGILAHVMTFNIRYDNPEDGINAWPNRKARVAETIRFHHVDIAGLQEALRHQISDLEERLPEYGWFGVGREDGKTRGEYAPVFYRKERFSVLMDSTFWLSQAPDQPGSMGWDAACTRIATWGKMKDRQTGFSFYVFNTHFDHIGSTAREESARLILRRIQEIAGGKPVILTGDFNSISSDPPYRILTEGGLSDVHALSRLPRYGSTQTFNGFGSAEASDGQIDFIFVKNARQVLRHGVISDRWDGHFVSDHHAVTAEIGL